MTTTKNSPRTEAITTLAAQLYQTLTELSTEPLVGSGVEWSELNYRWMEQARQHLHSFLMLNEAELEPEWAEMIPHLATMDAWQEYGS